MYRVNAIMIIMTTSCMFAQLLVPYMNFVYIHVHGEIPNGKCLVGFVVSQSLKFGWILTIFGKFSNNFSNWGNQSGNKSQFYNIAQFPL